MHEGWRDIFFFFVMKIVDLTLEGTSMQWVTSVALVEMGQGLALPTRAAHRSEVWS